MGCDRRLAETSVAKLRSSPKRDARGGVQSSPAAYSGLRPRKRVDLQDGLPKLPKLGLDRKPIARLQDSGTGRLGVNRPTFLRGAR
jgi:hypothetical protein